MIDQATNSGGSTAERMTYNARIGAFEGAAQDALLHGHLGKAFHYNIDTVKARFGGAKNEELPQHGYFETIKALQGAANDKRWHLNLSGAAKDDWHATRATFGGEKKLDVTTL